MAYTFKNLLKVISLALFLLPVSCLPNFFENIPIINAGGGPTIVIPPPIISAEFDQDQLNGKVIFDIANGVIISLTATNLTYTRPDNTRGYFFISDNSTNSYKVLERPLTNSFSNSNFKILLTNTNVPQTFTNISLMEETFSSTTGTRNGNKIVLNNNNGEDIGEVFLQTNNTGYITGLVVSNLLFDGSDVTNDTNYLYLSTQTRYTPDANSFLITQKPLINNFNRDHFEITFSNPQNANLTNAGIVFISNSSTDGQTTMMSAIVGMTFPLINRASYNVSGSIKIAATNRIEIIAFSDEAPGTGIYLVTSPHASLVTGNNGRELVDAGHRLLGYPPSDAPNGNTTMSITLPFDITTSSHTHVGVFCVPYGKIIMGETQKFK